jgi:hypothetical protein
MERWTVASYPALVLEIGGNREVLSQSISRRFPKERFFCFEFMDYTIPNNRIKNKLFDFLNQN